MTETGAARIKEIAERERQIARHGDTVNISHDADTVPWLLSRLRAKDRVIEAAKAFRGRVSAANKPYVDVGENGRRITSAIAKFDAALKEEQA